MNSKYKKLTEKFPGQHIVKVVAVTQTGSEHLSLKHRWLYSILIWRFRGHPVSKLALAKWSGVDRTRTLPKILNTLRSDGLVRQVGNKYRGVMPSDDTRDWFAVYPKPTGKLALSYNWAVYSPDRDILDGLVQAADMLGKYKAALLANWFGVTAKTITAARRRLSGVERKPDKVDNVGPVAKQEEQPMPTMTISIEAVANPGAGLADRFAAHFGITDPDTLDALSRTLHIFRGLSTKEQGQVVSVLIAKYGTGEALADYLHSKMSEWARRYFGGVGSVDALVADVAA